MFMSLIHFSLYNFCLMKRNCKSEISSRRRRDRRSRCCLAWTEKFSDTFNARRRDIL